MKSRSTIRLCSRRPLLPVNIGATIGHSNLNSIIACNSAGSSLTDPPIITYKNHQQNRSFGSGGGTRGSRGHGWYVNYRNNKGGRHLQGEHSHLNLEKLQIWNDTIFALGSQFLYIDIKVDPVVTSIDDKNKDNDDNHDDADNNNNNNNNSSGDAEIHRLKLELATTCLPRATENFMKLIQAEPGIGYKSSTLHRVEKKIGIMGGLVWKGDHKKSVPVGKCHPDLRMTTSLTNMDVTSERLVLSHIPGILTMLSPRVHEIDSRFLLCSQHAPHVDGKSVAIGRLADEASFDTVRNWEQTLITQKGRPTNVVLRIVECGLLNEEETAAKTDAANTASETTSSTDEEAQGKKISETS